MRSVVLLGAGASFGSEVDGVPRPPLGTHLFDCLDKAGGAASKLPEDLKDKFRDDFESGMAEFYRIFRGDTARFQSELAGYLANYSPTNESVYLSLLRFFKGKKVTYVSLNYDLLLEKAILSLGQGIEYSLQTGANRQNLLKIHGSSNMWPRAGNIKIGRMTDCTTDIVAPVDCIHPNKVSERLANWNGVAPVIAMYAKGKNVRNCPEYVTHQQKMWHTALSRSKELFIFGVRVMEEDEHVWRFIGEFSGDILYFGGPDDKDAFDSWKKQYPGNNAIFKGMYFKDSVDFLNNSARL